MIQYIALYFGFNIALAIILWLFTLPKDISPVGFFLMTIFFGLPILIICIVAFVFVLLAGATYNFGEVTENFFKCILK